MSIENLETLRDKISQLALAKKYSSAIEVFKSSQALNKINDGPVLIMIGDCYYESGNDLEALGCYIRYAKTYISGEARNFALFNAGVCLKNLGLYYEAIQVLEKVPKDHDGIDAELEDARFHFDLCSKAKKLLTGTGNGGLNL